MIRVLIALVLLSSPARAGECESARVLTEGAVAPCSGILVPRSDVAFYLAVEDDRDRLAAELVAARERAQIEAAAARATLDVERAARRACEVEKVPALPPPEPRFYESPWFGFAVGAVVGSGVVVTAIVLSK